MPPMVDYGGQPAMLRAWRRDSLMGMWWGLLTWLRKDQLPFGEPTYYVAERWVGSDTFKPVEGQDYSNVPRLRD